MLNIVTQNIWGKNDQWQARADAIGINMRTLEVDVLCIQESSPEHFAYVQRHSFADFPYAHYAPSDDGSITPGQQGLATFSRLPMIAAGKADLGREDHPQIDPWMRIIQYIRIEPTPGHTVTVFNTHLFLNTAQKRAGIDGCVAVMRGPLFADDVQILVGDFNILLDTPDDHLAALSNAGFVDVWRAQHPQAPGLTWPLTFDRPPQRRIDGHFIHADRLEHVAEIALANDQPINEGTLLLSDHVAVLGTYRLPPSQP
ncbi:MAG: hypothetical protein GYB67_06295 [Chloroflexi bacterium]|nr:hypothetical protein [Chloroflexota bacterium]